MRSRPARASRRPRSAIARTRSTIAWFCASRLRLEARVVAAGSRPRRSVESTASAPVRKPRPSGANGTNATIVRGAPGQRPRQARRASRARARTAAPRSGGSRRLARASPRRPRRGPSERTLPSATSSAMAPYAVLDRDARVDAVQVVEVDRVDAETLRASLRTASRIVLGASVAAEHASSRDPRRRAPPWWRGRGRRGAPRSPCRASCSFVKGPYTSEVSRNVTPSSSARSMTAIDSALVARTVGPAHGPCSRGRSRRPRCRAASPRLRAR